MPKIPNHIGINYILYDILKKLKQHQSKNPYDSTCFIFYDKYGFNKSEIEFTKTHYKIIKLLNKKGYLTKHEPWCSDGYHLVIKWRT